MTTARTEELTKLNQQWTDAYASGDAEFLERILSDDYVDTFPDGTVLDKKSEIEAVKSGAVAFTETPAELSVRVYGDAAVIAGRSTIDARLKGQNVSGEFRFTHTWIKRGDGWQVVASQVTRIVNPAAIA